MFLNNMRLAVFAAYVFVVIDHGGRMMPNEGAELIGLVLLANLVLAIAGRVWDEVKIRRYVNVLRSMDPLRSARIVQNMFWQPARKYYAERLAAEGQVETDGGVERFPFSARDRRENTILFWLIALAIVATVGSEFTSFAAPRGVAAGGVVVLVALLVWVRRVGQKLETVLTVSPFSIAELRPGGGRRSLTLDGPMELTANRRRGRIELRPIGSRDFIALDFRRLGFERLLDRVLEYGGFREVRAAEQVPDHAPAQAAAAPAPAEREGAAQRRGAQPRSVRSQIVRGAATVIPVATAFLLVRLYNTPSVRSEPLGRLSVDATRIFAQRMAYARRYTDHFGSQSDAGWQYLIVPCWRDSGAAWCLIVGTDTTVFARETLTPLFEVSGNRNFDFVSHYTPDTVRTDYAIDVAYSGQRLPRHATVPRRSNAWPEGFSSELAVALALPSGRTAVPLQPKRDEGQFVERTFSDENRSLVWLLGKDTAVAWTQGRDSGSIPVATASSPSPVDLAYRATVLAIRYPDRAVTLWVADSGRRIIRRETRFRTGQYDAVVVDSLIEAEPLYHRN